MMMAAWLTQAVIARRKTDWMANDGEWGLSTLRQRVLAMIRNLLDRPGLAQVLPGFAEMLPAAEARLAARWSSLPPMAPYPAFH